MLILPAATGGNLGTRYMSREGLVPTGGIMAPLNIKAFGIVVYFMPVSVERVKEVQRP